MKRILKETGFIVGIIYSVIFFAITFLLFALLSVSNLFNKDFYSKVIDSIDLSSIKINSLNISELHFIDETTTIEDYLVDLFKKKGISENDALSFINSDKIRDVFSDVVGEGINYVIFDKDIPLIDKDRINSIIDEINYREILNKSEVNLNVIIDNLNIVISDKLIEWKKNYVNSFSGLEKVKMIENFVKGPGIIISLIVFTLLSYLLLVLFNWNFILPLKHIGVSLIMEGILLIVIRFSIPIITLDFLGAILMPLLIYGGICLLSGIILLIICYSIINKKLDLEPDFDMEETKKIKNNNVKSDKKNK